LSNDDQHLERSRDFQSIKFAERKFAVLIQAGVLLGAHSRLAARPIKRVTRCQKPDSDCDQSQALNIWLRTTPRF
jgi:hypothetical protein